MLYLRWASYSRLGGMLCVLACVMALSASMSVAADYTNAAAQWADQDEADPVPTGGIVFMGSSSIRRWEQLQYDFADYNVVQRGLGGATFATYMPTIDQTVLAHKPRAIVTWLGTNDIAFGGPGSKVIADYANLISTVRATQPNVEFYFIGITPVPGRESNRAQENIANAGIANMAANDAKVHYIDIPTAFDNLGAYKGANYLSKFVDPLHLSRDGYDVWTSLIRPAIAADLAPDKVYTPNAKTLKQGDRLLFDFGHRNAKEGGQTYGVDANGNRWNNWHQTNPNILILPGEHIGNLIDTKGNNTGISLTLTAQFSTGGISAGGLTSPDPKLLGVFAVDTVTSDFFYSTGDNKYSTTSDDETSGGFKLTGLDREREYKLELFGSASTADTTRKTEYKILGDGKWVQTLITSGNNIGHDGVYDGNDNTIITFDHLRPNKYGELFLDMTVLEGGYAYLNAMQLTAGDVVSTPEPTTLSLVGLGSMLVLRRQ